MEINLRLFGAFRKFESNGPYVNLHLPENSSVAQIKQALELYLKNNFNTYNDGTLISTSAIADDHQLLNDDVLIACSCSLAILPPVSGG